MGRSALVLAVLAASLACACGGGQSGNEKLLIQRKGFCDASIGTTVGALSGQWGYLPNAHCETGVFATPNGNCDQTASLCRFVWEEFGAIDSSICGSQGCLYRCIAFAPPPPGTGNSSTIDAFTDAVICAQSFAQGQP
jgi:hypothetical protein